MRGRELRLLLSLMALAFALMYLLGLVVVSIMSTAVLIIAVHAPPE